MAKQIRIDIA